MPACHKQFAVGLIDASGVFSPACNIVLDALNVTTSASAGTVTTNDFGSVPEDDAFVGAAGQIIEFSSADYPGTTFRQTLAATLAEAYTLADNGPNTFIVENLFTDTTVAQTADIYAQDLDNLSAKPFYLGTGVAGATAIFPYQSSLPKNLRLYPVSKTGDGAQSILATDFSNSTYQDVQVSGLSRNFLIFEHFDSVTTAGIIGQSMFMDTIDAGTWAQDGDLLETEYSGSFAANANSKRIQFSVAGISVADIAVTENNTKWDIEISVMRVSNTTLRVSGTLSYGTVGNVSVLNQDITGLDLSHTDYDIVLEARTPSLAGDITANIGYGQFWRGTGDLILTIGGSDLTIGGNTLTI